MLPPPVVIRPLGPDDAAAYWNFRLEALEREPEAFSTSAEDHRATSVADAAALLSSDPALAFVLGAFADGRLVGTVRFHRERTAKLRHKAWVLGVYVTESARGSGIARRLLRELMARASATPGIEQLIIAVNTTRTVAAGLYRSLGFQPFGLERRALQAGGRYYDEEFLAWYVNPS